MVSSSSSSPRASSVTAIALVLVCAACGSVGSPQDQYKARGSSGHQPHPAAASSVLAQAATDQKPAADLHLHRIIPEQTNKHSLHEEPIQRERHRRAALERRRRTRRNSPWSGHVRDFSHFQPQPVQISRPYYIPVLYTASRIPVYFPPQPVRTNVGYPPDNKPGPQNAYLPPPPSKDPMNVPDLADRINGDSFVWDYVDAPAVDQVANSITTTTQRPNINRPTRPNVPVDRVPGDGSGGNNFRPSVTTSRPNRPSRPSNSGSGSSSGDGTIPLSNGGNSNNNNNFRPNQRPQRPTSQRPAWQPTTTTTPAPASGGRGESACVWAILSCCVPGNNEIKESCFANRGCSGPFWGNNPCDPMYTEDVIKVAMNYFE